MPGSRLPQRPESSSVGPEEALTKPGRREGLPISLPLNGWGWEALSMTGQPDPLTWMGFYHPGLVPVQAQPAKQAPPRP